MIRMTPEHKEQIKTNLEELTGREITDEDDYLALITERMVIMQKMMVALAHQCDEASGAIRHLQARWNQREW